MLRPHPRRHPSLAIYCHFNLVPQVDLEINIKIAHKEVSCKTEAVAVSATHVTFPKAATTGDCMGDALRGQGKNPSKYYLDVNSDGTLTFHSDGYPGAPRLTRTARAMRTRLRPLPW